MAIVVKKPRGRPRGFFVACTGPFAGKPAPTGTALATGLALSLWERVYPRRGQFRKPLIGNPAQP
ncbi:protein of unknown function [Pseudomonas sp. JV551A1]|nr:protein of unknown function [Pseudomonas sp. JV551A1]